MLFTEWNWDDALAVRYEEGVEEGIGIGEERGEVRGLDKRSEEILGLIRKGHNLADIERFLVANG
jgi:hypothetical protein